MAESSSFEESLQRVIEANLSYYESLGRVTQDYFKALGRVFRTMPVRIGRGSAARTPVVAKPANATLSTTAASLVLEAEAGTEAQGVFLVENKLGRTVSTAVMTSEFADPSGRAVRPTLRIVPNVVTLEPGGRTLVQIVAHVTGDLEADVPYRGEVSVPGLSDHGIPVLLRRVSAGDDTPATAGAGKGRAKRGRTTKRSKGRTKPRASSRSSRTRTRDH